MKENIEKILNKKPEERTAEELNDLQKESFNEKFSQRRKVLDKAVQETYEFMYPNSSIDETGRVVSDERKLPKDDEILKPVQNDIDEISAEEKIKFEVEKEVSLEENSQEKVQKIGDFIKVHKEKVGERQAVKDLQKGLNILNAHSKTELLPKKKVLKLDGKLGELSCECLDEICNQHDEKIIKKAVKIGAINNVIIKTQANPKLNTKNFVKEIESNFEKAKGDK